MNFRTESFDLPQNEQRKCLSWDMGVAAAGGGEVVEPVRAILGHETATERQRWSDCRRTNSPPEAGQADLRERVQALRTL